MQCVTSIVSCLSVVVSVIMINVHCDKTIFRRRTLRQGGRYVRHDAGVWLVRVEQHWVS